MAAGLRVETGKFEAFREAFCAHAREVVSDEMMKAELRVDGVAELRQINEAVVNELERMGPFGTGNGKPLLCCMELEVIGPPRRIGKNGDHVSMLVRQGGVTVKAIAFNRGELAEQLSPQMRIDAVVQPQINEFQGRRAVELEIRDVRRHEG